MSKALARWPDMVQAQIYLGNSLMGQQRYQDARDAFQRAHAKEPANAVIAYNLGILLLDGQLPDLTPVNRLERSVSYFEEYKRQSKATKEDDPVDAYIAEAKKRIVVEKKREEQMRRRPKPAPAPTPAEASDEETPSLGEPAAPAASGEETPSSDEAPGSTGNE